MQDEERVLMNRLIEAEKRAAHFEQACWAIRGASTHGDAAKRIAATALAKYHKNEEVCNEHE